MVDWQLEVTPPHYSCWLCESRELSLYRASELDHSSLAPEDFQITDSRYGTCATIYKCSCCGFLFCPGLHETLQHYQEMDDPEYEATSLPRQMQARKLIERLRGFQSGNRLMDVGAGTGLLVEEARKLGLDASGVEPSRALQEIAAKKGVPVLAGTLGEHSFDHVFDTVTLIDVIEHVSNPREMMMEISALLPVGGICAVVTPDIESLMARILKSQWWHFRIAHIAYFSQHTLSDFLQDCGFEILEVSRPGWYFPLGYLFERVMSYFPAFMRFSLPGFLARVTVPLNLRDSMLIVCRKK